MAQRESKLSRKIMGELRKMGVFSFKVWGNDSMMAGLPDIIACVDGHFVGFETKNPESRDDVSPRQVHVHGLIRASGGDVHVICSPAEAIAWVNHIRTNRHASGA